MAIRRCNDLLLGVVSMNAIKLCDQIYYSLKAKRDNTHEFERVTSLPPVDEMRGGGSDEGGASLIA